MIEIIGRYAPKYGDIFDFELANGTLLHRDEWNGEKYLSHEDGEEIVYTPVYRYEQTGVDISTLEENSPEWDEQLEIVGFY